MKKKNISAVLAGVMLVGCGSSASSAVQENTVENAEREYGSAVNTMPEKDSYTADMEFHYTLTFSDDTKQAVDLTGHLEQSSDSASFTQYFNNDGAELDMEGYYLDGKLYNRYGGITYYEEMSMDDFLETMLVPLEPVVKDTEGYTVTGILNEDGTAVYTLVPDEETGKDLFMNTYDVYEISSYDDYSLSSATVTVTFDTQGNMLSQNCVFNVSVSYSSSPIDVVYESSLKYSDIGSTEVKVSEETMDELKSYVNYTDIDTGDSYDDLSDGDTVTEQFENRIVSMLGYEKRDDGTYRCEFNENEMYRIDFDSCTFTYGRYSIAYVYNWKTDVASSDTCNYNFSTGNTSNGCDVSVTETMQEVKQYLEMELLYCGLSLEDLQKEAKEN